MCVLLRRYIKTDRAVQPQHNYHEEEYNGKERGSRHIGNSLCVDDEQQTGTLEQMHPINTGKSNVISV